MQHLTSSNPSLPACPRARSQYRIATITVAAANQMDEYTGIHVIRSGLS